MFSEEQYNEVMASSQLQQQMGMNAANTQQQVMFNEMEKGLAEEQLDVEDIVFSLYNLLCGNRIVFDETGRRSWEKCDDKDLRVLSDNGIQRMMQCIISYVNKLKMLSNHSNEEIMTAMYDFTTELNDNLLMKYEDLFYTPTFDECKVILDARLKEKLNIKKYAHELAGTVPDEDKIRKELLAELEGRIEYELNKIRDEERKKRIKEYGMLTLLIEHQVLDTYRRSEGGIERSSLRKHAQFTEVRALQPEQQKRGGAFAWLKS